MRPGDGAACNYRIERRPLGLLVYGSLTADELSAVSGYAKALGYDLIDVGVAKVMGATFALTNAQDAKRWRAELDEATRASAAGDEELAWLRSTDTGTSSLTIFAALSRGAHPVPLAGGPDVPYDPDDFGRCHRLLERFPAWRPRLIEVSRRHPAWAPFVREWARMTEVYERDLPSGGSAELYALMTELVEEGRSGARPLPR